MIPNQENLKNTYKTYISAGEVTLAGSLDYDSATSHTVTVEVSDGTLTASADLTVNVQEDQYPTISGNFHYCQCDKKIVYLNF